MKKCNLFVKGFSDSFTQADLKEVFEPYGEIESIKIINGKNAPRAFVCFKQPESAVSARSNLHQQQIQGKTLFVTNYELPEQRKKLQAEAKNKADFMNMRNMKPMDDGQYPPKS